jgi:uncharacterized protein YoxC
VIASVWGGIGSIAAIIAASFWAVLALFLAFMVFRLSVTLQATTMIIDDVRKETVPLLSEVTTTVSSVNKELQRVDGMVESAGNIVKSVERVSSVVEQAVSSPLVKVIAFSAGAQRAVARLRKKDRGK